MLWFRRRRPDPDLQLLFEDVRALRHTLIRNANRLEVLLATADDLVTALTAQAAKIDAVAAKLATSAAAVPAETQTKIDQAVELTNANNAKLDTLVAAPAA